MKKLMVAAAIVCAAVMGQAAQFTWNNVAAPINAYNQPGDTADLASGTIYLIKSGTGATQKDFISTVLGAGADYATAFGTFVDAYAYNSGTLADSKFTAAGMSASIKDGLATFSDADWSGTTYSFYQVMLDTANNGVYVSELVSGNVKSSGATDVVFSNDGAYLNNAYGTSQTTFAGDGWYTAASVPEPTSGLLLLLGMAGLALRRRRA